MTYEKVCEKLDIIIDVDNNDINNSHQLLDKIKNHIKSSNLFVCDITPDNFVPNTEISLPNPNTMIELGYALQYFETNNIILLLNDKISKNKPSMLSGFEITFYNSDSPDYYLDIIEKIESNMNNLYNKIGWSNFIYSLSDKFIISLQGIIDINISNYIIRVNNQNEQAVILFPCNGYTRIINIISKKLKLKNKEICLSNYDNLYNELQHLEIIINFKNNS
jgi:hypothetical protein